MRELSLHILDIVQNSLAAGAARVDLAIRVDLPTDRMTIEVADNGCGMGPEMVRRVTDPFVTTRTTRKVGLGLPLLQAATQRCNGDLSIASSPGRGTTVTATFQYSHIDRAPLGDIINTLTVIIGGNPEIAFSFTYSLNDQCCRLDTDVLRSELGDVPLNHPLVIDWIKTYLQEKMTELHGGEDW